MSYKNIDILIATTNPGKIAELQNLLGTEIRLLSLKDFESISEIKEDGRTLSIRPSRQINSRKRLDMQKPRDAGQLLTIPGFPLMLSMVRLELILRDFQAKSRKMRTSH